MRVPKVVPENRAEIGLTLAELLVAVAVLAIAIVVTLALYDRSRRSFKRGENAAEQQQAVRIAFDRINADLRMAGYNFNPDGDADTPDEQIEAAFAGAVVIRGDFDRSDEAPLGGVAQTSVSVGNDEIVMYALGKPGWSGGQTLQFSADVKDVPRDGVVETVSVTNVAATQAATNAPFTLYRIALNPDTSTWNSAGFLQRTPLVENVRSLTFRYFDQNNAEIDPTTLGGLDAPANKAARLRIRRINVSLIGLTRDPDLGWVDRADTNASTRSFRKFELTGDITPRNLGMKGIQDLSTDVVPPTQPGAPTLVPGHCQGLLVSWPANPSGDGVTAYRVYYGTSPGTYLGTRTTGTTSLYIGGLAASTLHYVAITALDAAANESITSPERNTTTTNTTIPSEPGTLTATETLTGVVDLSWGATTTNTAALGGDPLSPAIRDLAGYRVYRSQTANFGLTDSGTSVRANESTLPASPTPVFSDANVVNCRQYFYKVTAVDLCGLQSDPTPAITGQRGLSLGTVKPLAPLNVQALVAGESAVNVSWAPTTQDAGNPPSRVYIDQYRVYRTALCDMNDTACKSLFTLRSTTTGGATSLADTGASGISSTHTYYYRVTALDDCPFESDPSAVAEARCGFVGEVAFITPTQGAPVAGVVPTRVRIDNPGTDTYGPATFTFRHISSGTTTTMVDTTVDMSSGEPVFEVNWLAALSGQYAIAATVVNQSTCSKSTVITVNAAPNVACCLSTNYGQTSKVADCVNTSGNTCNHLTYNLYNNGCLTAVRVDGIRVFWSTQLNTTALLQNAQIPEGTTVWSPGSATSGTSVTFSDLQKPSIPVAMNYANPLKVRYVYTQAMSRRNGPKNQPLQTTIEFTLLDFNNQPTSITGTCGPTGEFQMAISEPR